MKPYEIDFDGDTWESADGVKKVHEMDEKHVYNTMKSLEKYAEANMVRYAPEFEELGYTPIKWLTGTILYRNLSNRLSKLISERTKKTNEKTETGRYSHVQVKGK